jgi:hypothetical protein
MKNQLPPLKSFTDFTNYLTKQLSSCTKATQEIANSALIAIKAKNKDKLCEICESGLPDDLPILRAYIWKINLGYLPLDIKEWDSTLTKKREEYKVYKKFIKEKLTKELEKKEYTSKEILEQIIKDVYRTNTQFSFFFQPTDKNKTLNNEEILNIYNKRKNWDFSNIEEVYKYDNFENEIHSDVLTRILFTYSSIIQDVSYHQGMNEILAPIYYSFSYDKLYLEEKEEDIEADSFWSFYFLLHGIKNNFEEDQEGLFYKSEILNECLKIVDENIYNKLIEKNVKCEFFCLRWFIVLFGQDFDMGDVLRIWDFVFSCENKNELLFYVCLSVIKLREDTIINGEMNDILQRFQNLRDLMCDDVVFLAADIRNKWKNKLDHIIKKALN